MTNPLGWLFGTELRRMGPAPAVLATAVAPQDLSAPLVTGRRDRALDGGDQVVLDGLATKVLHGWLQNRHQTLYPLTINLRTLHQEQREALVRWTAVALLAVGHPAVRSSEVEQIRIWFKSVGADEKTLHALELALADPPSLGHAVSRVVEHGVTPHAYVSALVALDPTNLATSPFLEYAAARFALPTTIVRSATRRYRR